MPCHDQVLVPAERVEGLDVEGEFQLVALGSVQAHQLDDVAIWRVKQKLVVFGGKVAQHPVRGRRRGFGSQSVGDGTQDTTTFTQWDLIDDPGFIFLS